MVSIIVPVYNVEKYIDRCIKSLVNQTFKSIEIIIIDDGSMDSTSTKCIEWSKRDDRIIYIRKENGGQGSARNLGIKKAKFDYITFADSDDWCHPQYVEKLYDAIVKYDSDIAVCNKYAVILGENISLIKHWLTPNKKIDTQNDFDLIYKVKYSLWAKMFKKKLFIENEIWQPNHKFENNTVIPMLVAKSKSICFIEDSLYYYWLNRGESTVNTFESFLDVEKCLNSVTNMFKESGLFELYYDSLMRFSLTNIKHALKKSYPLVNDTNHYDYKKIEKNLYDFMNKEYPQWVNMGKNNVCLWGSYNLRRVMYKLLNSPAQIKEHYSFSNIISAMSKCDSEEYNDLQLKNSFRRHMLECDLNKKFYKQNFKDIDYFFIDLLEERYGCVLKNNSIYSKSEVFDEVFAEELNDVSIFDFRDEKYFDIWKMKCIEFIKSLEEKIGLNKVIIVKIFLSEYIGDYKKQYYHENIKDIQEVNRFLNRCYDFIENVFKEVKIIELKDTDDNFTDKDFEFGCYPYHLNEKRYESIADNILNYLIEMKSSEV